MRRAYVFTRGTSWQWAARGIHVGSLLNKYFGIFLIFCKWNIAETIVAEIIKVISINSMINMWFNCNNYKNAIATGRWQTLICSCCHTHGFCGKSSKQVWRHNVRTRLSVNIGKKWYFPVSSLDILSHKS